MKVCLVGGIFGRPVEYREKHRYTPETLLLEGLRERGLHVDPVGHFDFRPSTNYDVIHVHHLGRAAVRMASSPNGVPFVFTSHDGAVICGYEPSLVRRTAFKYVARRCDAAIALSCAERDFMRDVVGLGDRAFHIPNGLRSDVFGSETDLHRPAPQGRIRLLYVGQLIPLKGVDVLLRAFARVAASQDIELHLAYQMPLLEQQLRELARTLGIGERVHFRGFLGADELAKLYRSVDALVLPSHAEALPSVVIEALLSGTPVVATRVGGIPEQVGEFGALARPNDPDDFARALREVLSRLPALAYERRRMREHAKATFDLAKMMDAHVQLYEAVARKARSARSRSLIDFAVRAAIEAY